MWVMLGKVADDGDADMTLTRCVCFASVLHIVGEEIVLREFIVKVVSLEKYANMVFIAESFFPLLMQTPSTVVMFLKILTLKQFDTLHLSHMPDGINS